MLSYTKKDKEKIYELEQDIIMLKNQINKLLAINAGTGWPVLPGLILWNSTIGAYQAVSLSGALNNEQLNITTVP